MNYVADPKAVRPKISAAEIERRREAVSQADADNRLEGIRRGPESDVVFGAYVRGDISVTDIVPQLKAQLGIK